MWIACTSSTRVNNQTINHNWKESENFEPVVARFFDSVKSVPNFKTHYNLFYAFVIIRVCYFLVPMIAGELTSVVQKLQFSVGGTNGMIISFICRKLKTKSSAYNKAVKLKEGLNYVCRTMTSSVKLVLNFKSKKGLAHSHLYHTYLFCYLATESSDFADHVSPSNQMDKTRK